MLKMYHYAKPNNTIRQDGLLAICRAPKNLNRYANRAHSEARDDIIRWLDSTFDGRSRSVSCLTEPIRWQNNDPMLKEIVDTSELISFDLEQLVKDGIVEAIWCKSGSDAGGINEKFYPVSLNEISAEPLNWEKCDRAKDLLFAVIRHYMLVLKDGVIPPQYLTFEK